SLWALSRREHNATAIRLFWWPSRRKLTCVRVHRTGDAVSLHFAQCENWPIMSKDQKQPKLNSRSIKLSVAQWARLNEGMDKANFWSSPVDVKEARGMTDGDLLLIEAIREGNFHVVERPGSIAGTAYKSFCRSLLELADPDTVKVWDEFRTHDPG